MPLRLSVNPRYHDRQKGLLHFFLQNVSSGFPFQASVTHCKTSRGILQVKYKEIKSRSPTNLQLHLRSGVVAVLLGQSVVAPNPSKRLQHPPSLHRAPKPKRGHTNQTQSPLSAAASPTNTCHRLNGHLEPHFLS